MSYFPVELVHPCNSGIRAVVPATFRDPEMASSVVVSVSSGKQVSDEIRAEMQNLKHMGQRFREEMKGIRRSLELLLQAQGRSLEPQFHEGSSGNPREVHDPGVEVDSLGGRASSKGSELRTQKHLEGMEETACNLVTPTAGSATVAGGVCLSPAKLTTPEQLEVGSIGFRVEKKIQERMRVEQQNWMQQKSNIDKEIEEQQHALERVEMEQSVGIERHEAPRDNQILNGGRMENQTAVMCAIHSNISDANEVASLNLIYYSSSLSQMVGMVVFTKVKEGIGTLHFRELLSSQSINLGMDELLLLSNGIGSFIIDGKVVGVNGGNIGQRTSCLKRVGLVLIKVGLVLGSSIGKFLTGFQRQDKHVCIIAILRNLNQRGANFQFHLCCIMSQNGLNRGCERMGRSVDVLPLYFRMIGSRVPPDISSFYYRFQYWEEVNNIGLGSSSVDNLSNKSKHMSVTGEGASEMFVVSLGLQRGILKWYAPTCAKNCYSNRVCCGSHGCVEELKHDLVDWRRVIKLGFDEGLVDDLRYSLSCIRECGMAPYWEVTYSLRAYCANIVSIPLFHNYRSWSFLAIGRTTYTTWYMSIANLVQGQVEGAVYLGPTLLMIYFAEAAIIFYTFAGHEVIVGFMHVTWLAVHLTWKVIIWILNIKEFIMLRVRHSLFLKQLGSRSILYMVLLVYFQIWQLLGRLPNGEVRSWKIIGLKLKLESLFNSDRLQQTSLRTSLLYGGWDVPYVNHQIIGLKLEKLWDDYSEQEMGAENYENGNTSWSWVISCYEKNEIWGYDDEAGELTCYTQSTHLRWLLIMHGSERRDGNGAVILMRAYPSKIKLISSNYSEFNQAGPTNNLLVGIMFLLSQKALLIHAGGGYLKKIISSLLSYNSAGESETGYSIMELMQKCYLAHKLLLHILSTTETLPTWLYRSFRYEYSDSNLTMHMFKWWSVLIINDSHTVVRMDEEGVVAGSFSMFYYGKIGRTEKEMSWVAKINYHVVLVSWGFKEDVWCLVLRKIGHGNESLVDVDGVYSMLSIGMALLYMIGSEVNMERGKWGGCVSHAKNASTLTLLACRMSFVHLLSCSDLITQGDDLILEEECMGLQLKNKNDSGCFYKVLVRKIGGKATLEVCEVFNRKLPFEFEIGYIGVGDTDEVRPFYHLFESEKDPVYVHSVLKLTGTADCYGLEVWGKKWLALFQIYSSSSSILDSSNGIGENSCNKLIWDPGILTLNYCYEISGCVGNYKLMVHGGKCKHVVVNSRNSIDDIASDCMAEILGDDSRIMKDDSCIGDHHGCGTHEIELTYEVSDIRLLDLLVGLHGDSSMNPDFGGILKSEDFQAQQPSLRTSLSKEGSSVMMAICAKKPASEKTGATSFEEFKQGRNGIVWGITRGYVLCGLLKAHLILWLCGPKIAGTGMMEERTSSCSPRTAETRPAVQELGLCWCEWVVQGIKGERSNLGFRLES